MKSKSILLPVALTLVVILSGALWLRYKSGPSAPVAHPPSSQPPQPASAPEAPAHPQDSDLHQKVALANAPQTVRSLVEFAPEKFADRLASVGNLNAQLTPTEIQALYAFLKTQNGTDEKTRGGEHVLKNQAMTALLEQSSPAGLGNALLEVYHDRNLDAVTRDYALQHLILLSERQSSTPRSLQGQILSALREALAETDSSIAGTALLGLHRLAAASPEIDARQLDEAALKLAADSPNHLARITAVQVCAERGLNAARPLFLDLARSHQDLPLQLSAIAALGSVGTPSEIPFLEQLLAGEDHRLKPAARGALQRLHRKLGASRPTI